MQKARKATGLQKTQKTSLPRLWRRETSFADMFVPVFHVRADAADPRAVWVHAGCSSSLRPFHGVVTCTFLNYSPWKWTPDTWWIIQHRPHHTPTLLLQRQNVNSLWTLSTSTWLTWTLWEFSVQGVPEWRISWTIASTRQQVCFVNVKAGRPLSRDYVTSLYPPRDQGSWVRTWQQLVRRPCWPPPGPSSPCVPWRVVVPARLCTCVRPVAFAPAAEGSVCPAAGSSPDCVVWNQHVSNSSVFENALQVHRFAGQKSSHFLTLAASDLGKPHQMQLSVSVVNSLWVQPPPPRITQKHLHSLLLETLVILPELVELWLGGLVAHHQVANLRSQLLFAVPTALQVSLQPLDISFQPATNRHCSVTTQTQACLETFCFEAFRGCNHETRFHERQRDRVKCKRKRWNWSMHLFGMAFSHNFIRQGNALWLSTNNRSELDTDPILCFVSVPLPWYKIFFVVGKLWRVAGAGILARSSGWAARGASSTVCIVTFPLSTPCRTRRRRRIRRCVRRRQVPVRVQFRCVFWGRNAICVLLVVRLGLLVVSIVFLLVVIDTVMVALLVGRRQAVLYDLVIVLYVWGVFVISLVIHVGVLAAVLLRAGRGGGRQLGGFFVVVCVGGRWNTVWDYFLCGCRHHFAILTWWYGIWSCWKQKQVRISFLRFFLWNFRHFI